MTPGKKCYLDYYQESPEFDPLGEVEAFGSYLSDGSLHGDMVRTCLLYTSIGIRTVDRCGCVWRVDERSPYH